MGVCQAQLPLKNVSPFVIDEKSFETLELVGIGGFAKNEVYKVRYKFNQKIYAMKIQSKLKIIKKKQTRSVIKEREILGELLHAWYLVNMLLAFQDAENLYIVMDFLTGGNLRSYILKRQTQIQPNQPVFTHDQACKQVFSKLKEFIAACTVRALIHCHDRNVIHRDIKPENLILDDLGYIRLADFGIAQFNRGNNSNDTSGTIGYIGTIFFRFFFIAPEVVCMQNHTFEADYFALGVILFEIAMNHRPYEGLDKYEIREAYLSKQVQITLDQIPYGWSQESINFINQLIQRKPIHRMPTQKCTEMKYHPWLRDYPWEQLELQLLDSPLMNLVTESSHQQQDKQMMQQQMDREEEDAWDKTTGKELLSNPRFQALFDNYEYNSYYLPFPQQIKPTR